MARPDGSSDLGSRNWRRASRPDRHGHAEHNRSAPPVRGPAARTALVPLNPMSTHGDQRPTDPEHLELPVEELLRRARPLPPHEDMVIDDIDEDEGRAFLAAIAE